MTHYRGWKEEDRRAAVCDILADFARREGASKRMSTASKSHIDNSTAINLLGRVDASVAQFHAHSANPVRHREIHEQLREIWFAAASDKTGLAEIEKLTANLSPHSKSELERRGAVQLELGLAGVSSDASVRQLIENVREAADSDTANAELARLKSYLRLITSSGAKPVEGRTRPGGRRSKPRIEPVVLGFARGDVSTGAPTPPVGGRPENEAQFELIMNLALDWLSVTGQMPKKGRSDGTPFGQFVYIVFDWLGLQNPAYLLRAFWTRYDEAGRRSVRPEMWPEQE